MPCYHPNKACQSKDGGKPIFCGPRFSEKDNDLPESVRNRLFFQDDLYMVKHLGVGYKHLSLPCGKCIGCRLERSRQWAVRCMHEASLHQNNSFITLTYSDENLPEGSSLCYRHFQLFMKRLRKYFVGVTIRFYMCGEYGEEFGRPHMHACLFGIDFPDKTLWSSSVRSKVYRSKILESLWPFGFSAIGDVNFKSAAYVARYIMKKVTGDIAEQHYRYVCKKTGKVFDRKPEFNNMSRKPGIGSGWFEKYGDDVFPHDYIIVNGKKCKPPRYYDSKFKNAFPVEFDKIKSQRLEKAVGKDNSSKFLSDAEKIVFSRFSKLKRKIK